MFGQLKKFGMVVALLTVPATLQAATISGQIDIVGLVDVDASEFSATGTADLSPTGTALQRTGDFTGYLAENASVTLFDIDFASVVPQTIWEVGGFSFVATSFSSFQDSVTKAFEAIGVISGNSFDDTLGTLSFTAQENSGAVNVSFSTTTVSGDSTPAPVPLPAAGPLLLLGLGGLAVARRKKSKSRA